MKSEENTGSKEWSPFDSRPGLYSIEVIKKTVVSAMKWSIFLIISPRAPLLFVNNIKTPLGKTVTSS